jgi:hypothetical protein
MFKGGYVIFMTSVSGTWGISEELKLYLPGEKY